MENHFLIGTDIGGTTFSSALFTEKLELISISDKNNIANFKSTEALLNGITKSMFLLGLYI